MRHLAPPEGDPRRPLAIGATAVAVAGSAGAAAAPIAGRVFQVLQ